MYTKPTGLTIDLSPEKIEHEGVDLPKDHFLQTCPFYILLGPPKSGKTTVIQTLITHEMLYLKKFNHILFISPSSFGNLELELEKNWYPSINLEWIYKKFAEISSVGEKKSQVLLIFDDCVSEMRTLEGKPDFTKLFYNRRHITPNVCLSIFLTSQYWTKIPSAIRAMCSGTFIFSINQSEWTKMVKELPLGENSSTLKTAIQSLQTKPHSFIHLNFNNNKKYLNFESELII